MKGGMRGIISSSKNLQSLIGARVRREDPWPDDTQRPMGGFGHDSEANDLSKWTSG